MKVIESKADELEGDAKCPGDRLNRIYNAIYYAALVIAISIWLLALRAPLWLDETGSYWIIRHGFKDIWANNLNSPSFPAYEYLLWLGSKIFGISEFGLKIPSLLAMLGAAYLLYLSAREIFEREIALIATIFFCLNPMITFAACDVRPYAFGMLATNAAILCAFRLRRNESLGLAALFGFTSALIIYFHFLMGVILPALLICFFVVKSGNRRGQWRQLGIASIAVAVTMLPVIPAILYMFRSSETHVFEIAPTVQDLLVTFVPVKFLRTQQSIEIFFYVTLIGAFIVTATLTRRNTKSLHIELWKIVACASLALIPILILYGVSEGTSIHIFAERHRIESASGIALCIALLFTQLNRRGARVAFCLVLVSVSVYLGYSSKGQHLYSWKGALEAAEKNASVDNAPVVICSDYPESDFATMPVDSAKESVYFTQLSYYKLSVPVVPLPRTLNDEAVRAGSEFLEDAAMKQKRFLALGYIPSYRTLDWLARGAADQYAVRVLGSYDGVLVVEFVPSASSVRW